MAKTIHVVFKTHLDIGFTSMARDVITGYTDRYLPRAIALSEELERRGGAARFVWTTGSWLIDHALRVGTDEQRERLDAALRAGRIRWHGLPLTTHTELMDRSLADHAASLSARLDARYGRRTIAAKMTDVPGHTIGLVPVLAHAGLEYLHLGVNGASAVPDVPEFFRWRTGDDEVIVHYARSYGSTDHEIAIAPGGEHALHLAHTGDNNGPPTADEVESIFAALAAAHPGAEIVASGLDEFAAAVIAGREQLPVLEAEIGDTWIHGAGADPLLTAQLGVLQRLRTQWVHDGTLDVDSEENHGFSEALLRIVEHTWGEDLKTYLPDYANYTKSDFAAARERDVIDPAANPADTAAYDWAWSEHPSEQGLRYSGFEASWAEQRAHVDAALAALSPVRAASARQALAELTPVQDETDAGQALTPGEDVRIGGFTVRFGADGSICGLADDETVWADEAHRLGVFSHQSFDERDEQRWMDQYCRDFERTAFWALPDQSSPGLRIAETLPASVTTTTLQSLRLESSTVTAVLTFPDEVLRETGAPRLVRIAYDFSDERRIDITVDVCAREASRIPEATWFAFRPVPSASEWSLTKLGVAVDPLDVVSRGNRTLHAASAVTRAGRYPLSIRSTDAPLVAVGTPSLLRFDDVLPQPDDGFSINLHNNVWGTNFRMWFDDDLRYRFALELGTPQEEM